MIGGLSFEWDEAKAQANLAKHGVPFDEAISLFLDPQRVEFDVSRLEEDEVRSKAVGSIGDRLFSIVYTWRGEKLRIISARRANAQEIRRYADRDLYT